MLITIIETDGFHLFKHEQWETDDLTTEEEIRKVMNILWEGYFQSSKNNQKQNLETYIKYICHLSQKLEKITGRMQWVFPYIMEPGTSILKNPKPIYNIWDRA